MPSIYAIASLINGSTGKALKAAASSSDMFAVFASRISLIRLRTANASSSSSVVCFMGRSFRFGLCESAHGTGLDRPALFPHRHGGTAVLAGLRALRLSSRPQGGARVGGGFFF